MPRSSRPKSLDQKTILAHARMNQDAFDHFQALIDVFKDQLVFKDVELFYQESEQESLF